MLQRLVALFFILALAGQVLASVCACLEEKSAGHAKMSCCLRKKKTQPVMKKKSCCDAPCGETSGSLPRSHTESPFKIPVIVRKAVEELIGAPVPRMDREAFVPEAGRVAELTPNLSRTPIIYLKNHAFLI